MPFITTRTPIILCRKALVIESTLDNPMTLIGVDDTDSRSIGMCTTFLATRIAAALDDTPSKCYLVRLHPAVKHKTRGNAAVAIPTDVDLPEAFSLAASIIEQYAVIDDEATHPGLVVAPHSPDEIPPTVRDFSRSAMREHKSYEDATNIITNQGYTSKGWKTGRGQIGAVAAIGAPAAFPDTTFEYITYRESSRYGTPRDVDINTVFSAAAESYPQTWDTIDRDEQEAVCIPNTPGPVLYGIRGESPTAVIELSDAIDSEPITTSMLFRTNQGTDAHLHDGTLGSLSNETAYRVTGTVSTSPATKPGGHVFFTIANNNDTLDCVAFEPTKRFRNHVRNLKVGDRITVCGEVTDNTLKLEKFAVRSLTTTTKSVPVCGECGSTMDSAGANQGYRCRDCNTTAPGKTTQPLARTLTLGWYEVPPCARRHIAKPLVRGGFDAPTNPEH